MFFQELFLLSAKSFLPFNSLPLDGLEERAKKDTAAIRARDFNTYKTSGSRRAFLFITNRNDLTRSQTITFN